MRKVDIIRKDGGFDTIETYNVNDFPFSKMNTKAINCRGKTPEQYIYDFCTFDIETTTIEGDEPYAFMYHWQMDIAGIVCTGRYWQEWLYIMKKLSELYKISDDKRLVIYVHNLGYEYQFIRDFLDDDFGGASVFAAKSRQPIRVNTPTGLEFRCSYKLTNMTLNKATLNELGVTHIKAVGDLDYRTTRTAKTPLTDSEFGYCVSDVVSLYELMQKRMENERDNLDTIPMTSTGYVRRDCRKACRNARNYRKLFNKLTINKEVYTLLKEAGRGGNTHANRYMSGRIWHNVDSFDFVSDYPAQMMLRKFPMTKFTPYGEIESMDELDELLSKNACLFRVTLLNVDLKRHIAMPYISLSKCTGYLRHAEDSDIELRLDNGRVLCAPYLSMTVTDIDFNILESQYNWTSIAISDMYIAEYGDLPKPIRDTVMDYYKQKCELKYEIKHTTGDKSNIEYLYAKSKNRLNGIFGMCYTDPVHDKIFIDKLGKWKTETPDITDALEKYQKNRNSFLYYAWGVWVTAWARLHLEHLIELTGQSKTIYCDTDSSKAVGVDLKKIDEFNEEIIALAKERSAYYDCHGERYYLGIAEHENKTPIAEFKTLGAKSYCYKDEKGFHLTVSGVSKAKNYETGNYIAVEEMGDIKNFKPGFIFSKAGGMELVYNDNIGIHEITINGCTMLTASNVAMLESTYTLGLTSEYAEPIGYNIYNDIECEGE